MVGSSDQRRRRAHVCSRSDHLSQCAEGQRAATCRRPAAELLAREAFVRRVIVSEETEQAMVFGGEVTVYNYNSSPVPVRMYAEAAGIPAPGSGSPVPTSDQRGYVVPPCAEAIYRIPLDRTIYSNWSDRPSPRDVVIESRTAVLNPLDGRLWSVPWIAAAGPETSPLGQEDEDLMESIGWNITSKPAKSSALPNCV